MGAITALTRTFAILASLGFIVMMAGCSPAGVQPPVSPNPTTTPSCPNPLAVIKAFYDANDASQYDASLALLTPDITLASWAEGVNGRHWQEKHLAGKDQILPLLAQRGLRRASEEPSDPIFHETEAKVSGDLVTFMLRPDRLSPDGKQYNPYKVEAIFLGCKIKSLTVIMYFTVP